MYTPSPSQKGKIEIHIVQNSDRIFGIGIIDSAFAVKDVSSLEPRLHWEGLPCPLFSVFFASLKLSLAWFPPWTYL